MALTQPGMRQVQCKQCLAVNWIPDGSDPHAVTWCGCCTITGADGRPHNHGQAASACPGTGGVGHPGAACPVANPLACTVVTPPGEPCPGGHCGPGVDGCTVCRPIIHFAEAGDLMVTAG